MSAASDALDALSAAIDGLLAAPDVFDGDDELHAFVIRSQREQHRLVAALAPALNRWDRLSVWATDGSLTAASRLSVETHLSKTSARRELRRAKELQEMPATASALADGDLSPDHVDLLGRAKRGHRKDRFAEDEQTLVDACKPLLFDEAVRAVSYWRYLVDGDGAGDEPATKRRDRTSEAHLHASETLDGNVVINGLLDPTGGEIFTAELHRLEHVLYLADKESGTERPNAERRAAALIEMATRSASMPADARRPKPLFVVHVGDETARHLCELASGTVLTPGDLVNWLDDAVMETFLFDGANVVLTASMQRSFTGKLRSAIQARDRRCQHPSGCTVPAVRCDINHIVPWSEGGITSQFNGNAECAAHNRHADKHDHGSLAPPEQAVDRLRALRAKCRWVYRRHLERDPYENEPLG